MNKRDPIPPMRPRSSIPMRGGESSRASARRFVRARSPIRVYNQTQGNDSGERRSFLLKTLFKQVREQAEGCPLTVVLHGWRCEAARSFFSQISPLLQEGDVLWLVQISDENISASPIARFGTVLLNPSRDTDSRTHNTDRRIHDNLVSDIVFFSASELAEVRCAASFIRRASAIIIDGRGEHHKAILEATRWAGLIMCSWSGSRMLAECSGIEESPLVTGTADVKPEADLEEIGEMLKTGAKNLESEYDRRLRFRTEIQKVLEEYPGRPTWNADLIRLADIHDWPKWTVGSLPSLYARTEELPDGGARALVWHYVRDCLPENPPYESGNNMWNEEFSEIRMTATTARIGDHIAIMFERHLNSSPYLSESSFKNAINEAMQEVELFLQNEHPETAAKVKMIRDRIVKDMLSSR